MNASNAVIGTVPPQVCFLLGLPRSGTTLLAHLLQQHPDLLAPPEPWLMLALEAFGKVDRTHAADAAYVKLAADEFLSRINKNEVFRTFADAAYGQYLSNSGKKCFVDKTPRYWMVLDFIDALYPESPHIVLLRNPYAIAASVKATWDVPLLLERCPPEYASHLADRVLGPPFLAKRQSHPRTHVMRYEDLVAQPIAEVRRLVAWLGYDAEMVMSLTAERTDYLRAATFGDRNILKKSKIDSESIDTWRHILTLEEMQALTDMIGAEVFRDLGYDKELAQAKAAGVIEKSEAQTHWYRQVLKTWWYLSKNEHNRAFASAPDEPESLLHKDPTIVEQASRLVGTPHPGISVAQVHMSSAGL